MRTYAGMADSHSSLCSLHLKVCPIGRFFPAEFLPPLPVSMNLRPSIPYMGGYFKGLHDTRSTHGVHTTYQTSRKIGWKLPGFTRFWISVIAIPRLNIIPSLSIGANPNILVCLYITYSKSIVQFKKIQIFSRISNSSHTVTVPGSHSSGQKSGKPRISITTGESFTQILILVGRFMRKQRYIHISP